jgi:hypothetical protein
MCSLADGDEVVPVTYRCSHVQIETKCDNTYICVDTNSGHSESLYFVQMCSGASANMLRACRNMRTPHLTVGQILPCSPAWEIMRNKLLHQTDKNLSSSSDTVKDEVPLPLVRPSACQLGSCQSQYNKYKSIIWFSFLIRGVRRARVQFGCRPLVGLF